VTGNIRSSFDRISSAAIVNAIEWRPKYQPRSVNLSNFVACAEDVKIRRCERHCYRGRNKGIRILGVPLDMSRIHSECGNPFDQSVVADLILRQEPDDEEDDEENQDDGTKDDDRDDDGYSE